MSYSENGFTGKGFERIDDIALALQDYNFFDNSNIKDQSPHWTLYIEGQIKYSFLNVRVYENGTNRVSIQTANCLYPITEVLGFYLPSISTSQDELTKLIKEKLLEAAIKEAANYSDLHMACLVVQTVLGVKSGGLASALFSDWQHPRWLEAKIKDRIDALTGYAKQEILNAIPEEERAAEIHYKTAIGAHICVTCPASEVAKKIEALYKRRIEADAFYKNDPKRESIGACWRSDLDINSVSGRPFRWRWFSI